MPPGSLRVVGGLGAVTEAVLEFRDVEIQEDGSLTTISLDDQEKVLEALCASYLSLGREKSVVLHNLANIKTTRTADGTPYRRRYVVRSVGGIILSIQEDMSDLNWVYEPSHPDAEREGAKTGYLARPNVDRHRELARLEEIEWERETLRSMIRTLDEELVLPQEPAPRTPEPVSPKAEPERCLHTSISPRTLERPSFDESMGVRQRNAVSCGQASVATALNWLNGSQLNDRDIDQRYGFQLLRALKSESPGGVEWRDAGDLSERTWQEIKIAVEAGLPALVAFREDSHLRRGGTIVTIVGIRGDLATFADPRTGRLASVSKQELLVAEEHPDGNFVFLPHLCDQNRQRSQFLELG